MKFYKRIILAVVIIAVFTLSFIFFGRIFSRFGSDKKSGILVKGTEFYE